MITGTETIPFLNKKDGLPRTLCVLAMTLWEVVIATASTAWREAPENQHFSS